MKTEYVSVIGLDPMGSAIAARIVACGYPVSVFDHCRERIAAVSATGARPAAIPADAAEEADVVFVNMPDEATCHDVLLDHGGVGETLRYGGVVIDSSATGDAFNFEANRKLGRFGITRVLVELHGEPAHAARGRLRIVARCRRSDLAEIGKVIDSIAEQVSYRYRDETSIDDSLERLPALDPA